jgi:hypothetical protein
MIKAFKQWLAKAAYEGMQQGAQIERTSNRLGDMLAESGATIVAFQIDNGFVVRTINRNAGIATGRTPGFTYCADHQAIADHLVSSAMRDKLGVQSDMFEKEKQAAQRQYAAAKANSLIGAQSRI